MNLKEEVLYNSGLNENFDKLGKYENAMKDILKTFKQTGIKRFEYKIGSNQEKIFIVIKQDEKTFTINNIQKMSINTLSYKIGKGLSKE